MCYPMYMSTALPSTTTALASAVWLPHADCHGYELALVDSPGSWLQVLSVRRLEGRPGMVTGYSRSRRTGALYAYRQSGESVRQSQVRVRVTAAEDTGDEAATLRFDWTRSVPGRINVGLVAQTFLARR